MSVDQHGSSSALSELAIADLSAKPLDFERFRGIGFADAEERLQRFAGRAPLGRQVIANRHGGLPPPRARALVLPVLKV